MRQGFTRPFLTLAMAGIIAACATNMPATDARPAASAECNPRPDPARLQYIVGYGSLMQEESRKRTSPQAGPPHPVEVAGYRRGWFAKGSTLGYSTTFLGAMPDQKSKLNAVMYEVGINELTATDQREASYCRQSVSAAATHMLVSAAPDTSGAQVWIYANRAETVATPSAGFPIVQSYVDIFVSGCLEQEQRFELKGFAEQCLVTTQDWSKHWVNDRIYPRRPFIYQPKAAQIDALLSRQLPVYFSRIAVE